jgi:hypothetical protein
MIFRFLLVASGLLGSLTAISWMLDGNLDRAQVASQMAMLSFIWAEVRK